MNPHVKAFCFYYTANLPINHINAYAVEHDLEITAISAIFGGTAEYQYIVVGFKPKVGGSEEKAE